MHLEQSLQDEASELRVLSTKQGAKDFPTKAMSAFDIAQCPNCLHRFRPSADYTGEREIVDKQNGCVINEVILIMF
jgi:hypothetical protein